MYYTFTTTRSRWYVVVAAPSATVCGIPVLLAALLTGSCSSPADPEQKTTLAVVSTEAAELLVISVETGGIIKRPRPVPRGAYPITQSPDGSTIVYSGSDTYASRELVLLNTRSLAIEQRLALADLEEASVIQGLELFVPHAAAPRNHNGDFLIAPARLQGTVGVAVISGSVPHVTHFLPSNDVIPGGLLFLGSPHQSTSSTVALLVASGAQGARNGWLRLMDGITLLPIDSLRLTANRPDIWAGLGSSVWVPSSSSLYFQVDEQILRFDPVSRTVLASTSAPIRGRLSPGSDGTLFLLDGGDGRTVPGTGILYMFDSGLSIRDSVDLRDAAVLGSGPTIQGAASTADGGMIYVLIGNPSVGPSFPGQSLRLLTIDRASKKVVRSRELHQYGATPLLLIEQAEH